MHTSLRNEMFFLDLNVNKANNKTSSVPKIASAERELRNEAYLIGS